MEITLRSLYLVGILHVLAFGTILCKNDGERKKRELSADDLAVRNLLHSTEGFLAGEDTPVWIAYRPDANKPVNYTKLEKGIVKKAIDYRNSVGFEGFNPRGRRSIEKYTDKNSAIKNSSSSMPDVNEETRKILREIKSSKKRSIESSQKILYPSVLVMMDYVTNWPADKPKQEKLIKERILYALAFWNGVDLQLRHLKNPKVRLRIAGIIIGRNKEATPYLREHEGWRGLDLDNAYQPMIRYWGQMSNINRDFSPNAYDIVATMTEQWGQMSNINRNFSYDAYDIVATMTDATPSLGFLQTIHGVASPKPPCHQLSKDVAVTLFPDDLAFKGLQTAVHETAHVLGGKHDAESGYVLSPGVSSMGRKWSTYNFEKISQTLNEKGWCMEEPRVYHRPGKPVETILPGKLMPASKQCQARGRTDGNVCWAQVTCDDLYCANNDGWNKCTSVGAPPDGTTCNPGKMCLDGKCVSNTTMAVV